MNKGKRIDEDIYDEFDEWGNIIKMDYVICDYDLNEYLFIKKLENVMGIVRKVNNENT